MRQGNVFNMPVKDGSKTPPDTSENFFLPVPLELVMAFEGLPFVRWVDNLDGTFTVTPFKE